MSEIAEDIKKTAAWIAAHRHDLRTPAGTQMFNLIASALDNERSRSLTRIAALEAENERLRKALEAMVHAVCGETGFANAVRVDSGTAYPWPALDIAEEQARAALEAKP